MFKKYALLFVVAFILVACATVPTVDPTAYTIDKGPRDVVPKHAFKILHRRGITPPMQYSWYFLMKQSE